MYRKPLLGMLTALLLISLLTLALNIQSVKANGTIYIRADGSVKPPTAPIFTEDNVTYTFIGDIFDSIVVERDTIIIDGAGHRVQGPGTWWNRGLDLSYRSNVTVKNTIVESFQYGIFLRYSNSVILVSNDISNNNIGIDLRNSVGNNLTGNNVVSNGANGIHQVYSHNNLLSGNNLSFNRRGIRISDSNDNNLSDNEIFANSKEGIRLLYSNDNLITGNNIYDNRDGMYIGSGCSGNNFNENNIFSNNYYGILLCSSHNNFTRNQVTKNGYLGIYIQYASGNTFVGNDVSNNSGPSAPPALYPAGISLLRSAGNNFVRNNICNNYFGIRLRYCGNTDSNNFTENTISCDKRAGITILWSRITAYHNNFIDNAVQVLRYADYGNNVWDNDYPSGGNYWSDYTGNDTYSGPYQNETGSDGIGDTPYVIDGSNQDNYPLMKPWSVPPVVPWYPSEYVESAYKIADFEAVEEWVWENCVPLLFLNTKSHSSLLKPPLVPPSIPPDADTELQEPEHRPDYCYRITVDESSKLFVVQLIGNWSYQHRWIIPPSKCSYWVEHPWDYEPIFLYYKYTGDDFYSSIQANQVEYQYIFHTVWHGYVDTLVPHGDGTDADAQTDDEKLFFWEGSSGNKHPVFVLGSTHECGGTLLSTNWLTSLNGHAYGHVRRKGDVGISRRWPITGQEFVEWSLPWDNGYEGVYPDDKVFDQTFKQNHLKRLTDPVIKEWEGREENPFKMTPEFDSRDLVNPWNEEYNDKWPSVGGEFDPVVLVEIPILGVKFGSEVDLHVFDPFGRHVGMNYERNEVEVGVPNSYYYMVADQPQFIMIPESALGDYEIVAFAKSTGSFTMSIVLYNSIDFVWSVSDTIEAGQILASDLSLSISPVGELTATATSPSVVVIEEALAKANEVLTKFESYVDATSLSEELKDDTLSKILDIRAEKEEAMKEMIDKAQEMIEDAGPYIEDAKEHELDVSDAEDVLAKAIVEFDAENYELALRDALMARKMAMDALQSIGVDGGESSLEIWNRFNSRLGEKFDEIFRKLDEFNEFIDKYVDLCEIPPEVSEDTKSFNAKIKNWIRIAVWRINLPLE